MLGTGRPRLWRCFCQLLLQLCLAGGKLLIQLAGCLGAQHAAARPPPQCLAQALLCRKLPAGGFQRLTLQGGRAQPQLHFKLAFLLTVALAQLLSIAFGDVRPALQLG